MKNLTYSAISYVAAALILSGQALANPADLSGAFNNSLNAGNSTKHVDSTEMKQGIYLALNRYPVALPPLSTERSTADKASIDIRNGEAYIDSLQRELRDELDILIESQDFAAE